MLLRGTTRSLASRRLLSSVCVYLSTMPQPPHTFGSAPILDLSELAAKLHTQEAQRHQAYENSRVFHQALLQNKQDNLQELLKSQSNDRTPRTANWSHRLEEYTRHCALQHFLTHGTLLEPATLEPATDEEYLSGACMGLCQELQRYALGRATVRDVDSVAAAHAVASLILEYLLEFDFRNGPLRRKYDGCKYSVKALETLLYELAVTGTEAPPEKKLKASVSPALEELRLRYQERDQLRENLIKQCRDGQKSAKQAIFALHRGDVKKARQLLMDCEKCIMEQLWPIVQQEPPLRGGSFGNVLEEYVEAQLFAVWLHGKDWEGTTQGTVLLPNEWGELPIEPEDYLGGLCDLTGEIGRYAVQRGTARDVKGVELCWATNHSICQALEVMDRLPSGINKKMETLRRSVEKIERMLYEMSLSEAAGGRAVQSEAPEEPEL